MSEQYLEFQRSASSIFMQPKLIHDLNVLILVSLHEGCARLPDTGTMQCYNCQNPYFCWGGSVTSTRSVSSWALDWHVSDLSLFSDTQYTSQSVHCKHSLVFANYQYYIWLFDSMIVVQTTMSHSQTFPPWLTCCKPIKNWTVVHEVKCRIMPVVDNALVVVLKFTQDHCSIRLSLVPRSSVPPVLIAFSMVHLMSSVICIKCVLQWVLHSNSWECYLFSLC